MNRRLLIAISLAVTAIPAYASAPVPADADALHAIDASAAVMEAIARSQVSQARSSYIRAGTHEWTASGIWQERTVDASAGATDKQKFNEWEATLARGIRLPGKGSLDRKIAGLELTAADNALADARHMAALELLDAWFAWLNAQTQSSLAQQFSGQAQEQLRIVQRRLSARDASVADLELAQASAASARAAQLTAEQLRDAARAKLQSAYPSLSIPHDTPTIDDPDPPAFDATQWRQRIIERSHEIALAAAEKDRDLASASRASLDRIPDPIIGVRIMNERAGDERAVGVMITQPLGGSARRAAAAEQRAKANASTARWIGVQREIEAHAAAVSRKAFASREIWATHNEAKNAAQRQYERARRGYELGEFDMTALLTSARIALENSQAELQARLAAHYDYLRLQIDAHERWMEDPDHEHQH